MSASAPVVWFSGLSGAGKTTIAIELVAMLERRGLQVEHLDGDAIRKIFPDTGFSRVERDAHIRRVGLVAHYLQKHGVYVVGSLISPYADSRAFVRGLCPKFVEVYVSTPIEECERRDVKGLYARARRNEIASFTGISEPYEVPMDPELTLDSRTMSPKDAATRILDHIAVHHIDSKPSSNG